MASSRSVMVCCVTFETIKVIDPAIFHDVGKIHIIHYTRDESENSIYSEFYFEVCASLHDWGNVEIVEHKEKVYDFPTMLALVHRILEQESKNKVYVNISSGTSEYAAAAMVASLMHPNAVPFTVGTKEYTVPREDLKDLYYVDGKPVGLTKSVYDPKNIPTFDLSPPDRDLLLCLDIMDRRNREDLPGTSSYIINELKAKGIWKYKGNKGRDLTDERQKELMYYKRHFTARLIEAGWVEDRGMNRRYILTDKGSTILNVFLRSTR